MKAISCKCGSIFSACNSNYQDAEWKLQEAYYKAQGCSVDEKEEVRFYSCECEHRKSLEHNFEELIEEIIKNH